MEDRLQDGRDVDSCPHPEEARQRRLEGWTASSRPHGSRRRSRLLTMRGFKPPHQAADFARRANLSQSAPLISPPNQNQNPSSRSDQRGVSRSSRTLVRDAVDADGALTNAPAADGEVVWS